MSINQDRITLFEADLKSAFKVIQLDIEDESHLHAGHAGAASGGGHFKLTIVAPEFEGMSKSLLPSGLVGPFNISAEFATGP